ncbi:MAG: bifunctional serine/threonine-protein kinase/formylglycine-generating enzyme family protein [Planctomycetota bacterium]|nr:bifunctional serine/threonine-protein kinase/formylglycine-generating enzyme family protein [Planctomycetota bacterium]
MTDLRLEGQTWWFKEENSQLDTRDVMLRFLAGEIDGSSLCRNEEDPDWKSIKQRFKLCGPYAILRKLGEGAFGVVYLGIHRDALKHQRPSSFVALKSPTEALLDRFINAAKKNEDPQLSEAENKAALRSWAKLQLGELFSKEAALTARFAQCPHVVNVLDHNISTPYLALEFCNGGSLADRIRKPYQWEDVLSWSIQLSKALVVAHSLNPKIVHRDLKPDNVLIHNSQLKLGDLGTSQLLQSTESLQSLKGGFTPSYAAPEAFDAKAYPATDIWSLGVMLYEFISGELPFKAASMSSLMKAITVSEPKELKNGGRVMAPGPFLDLIHNCLNKEVGERPTAEQCLKRLQELEQQSSEATVLSPTAIKVETDLREDENPRLQRRDLVLATSIILLAIALTGLFAYFAQSSAPKEDLGKSETVVSKERVPEKLSRVQLRRLLKDLKLWDAATPKAQDQAIQYVLKLMGSGFRLDNVQPYECAGIKHRIARLIHNPTGMMFQLIPGGEFTMGGGREDAQPAHKVTIKRPFLISPTELSQGQWKRLGGINESSHRGDAFPVERVSRKNASGIISNFGFRFPSESEWEYACRAGSTTKFFWGEKPDNRYSWNCDNRFPDGSFRRTMPTLTHLSEESWNAFGLCDMPGNVWEYCSDHWMSDYKTGPTDERPRLYSAEKLRQIEAGKIKDNSRRGPGVMRGGSWVGGFVNGPSGLRNGDEWEANEASEKVGLRLCMSIPGFTSAGN